MIEGNQERHLKPTRNFLFSILFLTSVAGSLPAMAQQPQVGRGAAAKYFPPREPNQESGGVIGAADHFMAIGLGTFTSSQAYEWGGKGKEENVGGTNVEMTYRVGEWANSMDMNIRVEFIEYKVAGQKPTKLSFMPLLTFPDASSKFPLYFGAGVGLGIFTSQIPDESVISLDYELIAGARFFNVFENTGFFLESGLKNHLLLLSSGQFNGVFVAAGAIFTF